MSVKGQSFCTGESKEGCKDEEGGLTQHLMEDHETSRSDQRGCAWRIHCFFPTGFRSESRHLMHLLPPLIISMMCQWYVQPIAVIFAGHLGKIELDAVGLACSLINVLGYSLAFGMTAACDASFAQTFGGNNKKMMGVYLQRCLFLIVLSALPCYAIHLNIEGLLQLMGQDPEVARLVGRYLLVFTPGTFALFLYQVIQKYFQCQSIVYQDIWMGILCHIIHALLQYVLLYQLNMGIDGSAIAMASFYVVSLLLRLIYFFYSDKIKITWGGWTWQCFTGWGPLGKLAIYGAILMCAEWWAYEASSILAGLLGTAELGAQTIIFNMNLFVNSIPTGVAMATLVQMGQYLGAGKPQHAMTTSRIGTVFQIVFGIIFLIIMLSLPHQLASIFTTEQDVLNILMPIMPLLAIYVFLDGMTILGRNMFRVVAKQKEAAIVVFVSYYLLSMPLGYSLMFLTPLRMFGMWLGFVVVNILMVCILTVRYLWFFDWKKISEEAQIRACAKDQSLPEELAVNQSLVRDSVKFGFYGTLEKPTVENSFCTTTESLHVSHHTSIDTSHHMSLDISNRRRLPIDGEDEKVTWRVVLTKVLIILLFVFILLVGVMVRLGTADIVTHNRVTDSVTTEPGHLTNAPNTQTDSMPF